MNPGKYIIHLTLNTGHSRRSYREEVTDDVIAMLDEWMTAGAGSDDPLQVPNCPGYTMTGEGSRKCAVFTVFARDTPIATFGIAGHSRCGGQLWKRMIEDFGAVNLDMPAPPWCVVAVHAALSLCPDANVWLGDFERCMAWWFLERGMVDGD